MSSVTPPPDLFTSQNHAACGPSCFSACLIKYGFPSAPSSTNRFNRTYFGVKQSSSAYISFTLCFLHAAIIRSASASVVASGFSHTTCFPAAAASSVNSQCRLFGHPSTTSSTSDSRNFL